MMNTLSLNIVQFSAGTDVAGNLARIESLLAATPSCDLIALPEAFHVRGGHDDYVRNAEPVDGPTIKRLARLAADRNCWLLAGSLMEKSGHDIFNTCVLLDRSGQIHATYRKIHLFEAHLEEGQTIRESDTYSAGCEPVDADVEGWRCGLSICYDLRFPELYRHYSAQGAHLLFIPSNFTQRTGKDHWQTLVRARAIENQCFVVAPDQCGANPVTGVESHGHSMVVDPWGKVLAEAQDTEAVISAALVPAVLEQTRARIPVLKHRRL